MPHKVPADGSSELHVLMFGGQWANGKRFVVGEFTAGGSGGGPRKDGVDVIETDGSNCMNLPVEALELEAPIRVRRMALRPDSGGAGRYRGGLGCVREFEFLEGEVVLTHRGERHFHPAQGSQGGGSGACSVSRIVRGDGSEDVVRSKLLTTVKAGDRLIVETAGGGGYGNPREREREAVTEDVRNGKVSKAEARSVYGLASNFFSSNSISVTTSDSVRLVGIGVGRATNRSRRCAPVPQSESGRRGYGRKATRHLEARGGPDQPAHD
jgi:N-methylhydantoinase B